MMCRKTAKIMILVFAFILLSCNVMVASAATTYFSDDFSQDTAGAYPSNFTVVASNGIHSEVVVNMGGNNEFELRTGGVSVVGLSSNETYFALENNLAELELSLDFVADINGAEILTGFATSNQGYEIKMDYDGSISNNYTGVVLAPAGTIVTGQPYHLRIVMDVVNNTATTFITNNNTTTTYGLNDSTTINTGGNSGLRLYCRNYYIPYGPSIYRVDNIVVRGTSIVTNPQTGEASWLENVDSWVKEIFLSNKK